MPKEFREFFSHLTSFPFFSGWGEDHAYENTVLPLCVQMFVHMDVSLCVYLLQIWSQRTGFDETFHGSQAVEGHLTAT
jgi:hypothetical protein